MTETTRTTRVWADTVRPDRCRAASCRAPITFAVNVKSGNPMPFDGELVALKTERDEASGRQIWHVDLNTNHFGTCPERARFSSHGRR